MMFSLIYINYSLHIIIVLLFLINIIDGSNWRCDYTYVRKANGYFKFHEIPANWRDARLRCDLEGAVLASPFPQEINETLLQLMTDHRKDRAVFIGIHATFSNGDYYTINGIPLRKIPLKWMQLEPDNKNDAENCLILFPNGLAADTKCSDTHPYFCYKEKKHGDLFMDVCGTSDPAYEYSPETHSCYKFHTVPRTWSRAHLACSAEGGHLAIMNSVAEVEFIKKFYTKYPPNTMIGNFNKDVACIGFQDWDEHGDWRTIHSETLHSAGYVTFGPGQPDNYPPGEYCGSIFRTGLLNDLPCNLPYAFICEKKPISLICDDEEYK